VKNKYKLACFDVVKVRKSSVLKEGIPVHDLVILTLPILLMKISSLSCELPIIYLIIRIFLSVLYVTPAHINKSIVSFFMPLNLNVYLRYYDSLFFFPNKFLDAKNDCFWNICV
jgi:hypothetical protein